MQLILQTRGATGGGPLASEGQVKLVAVLAHPADLPGGHAGHEGVGIDIAVNDGTGGDERVFAQGDPANYCAVGAKGYTALDQGVAVFVFAADGRAGVVHIGEYHAGPAEYIVLKSHVIVHRDIVLDLAIVADYDPIANEDVLTKGAIAADFGTTADVYPMPNTTTIANLSALVNDGGGVNGDSHINIQAAGQRACRHGTIDTSLSAAPA